MIIFYNFFFILFYSINDLFKIIIEYIFYFRIFDLIIKYVKIKFIKNKKKNKINKEY